MSDPLTAYLEKLRESLEVIHRGYPSITMRALDALQRCRAKAVECLTSLSCEGVLEHELTEEVSQLDAELLAILEKGEYTTPTDKEYEQVRRDDERYHKGEA